MSAPIAGRGSEMWTPTMGWSHCGACGYTGRVEGLRQRRCKHFIWHGFLALCADREAFLLNPEQRGEDG